MDKQVSDIILETEDIQQMENPLSHDCPGQMSFFSPCFLFVSGSIHEDIQGEEEKEEAT